MNEPPVGYGPIAVAVGRHMLTVFTYIFMNASDFGTMQEAALAAWATRDLPARLDVAATARLLGFAEHDIQILMGAGMLTPLGDPAPNAAKWFATIKLIRLATDPEWLHKATKVVTRYWRQKRERRGDKRGGAIAGHAGHGLIENGIATRV